MSTGDQSGRGIPGWWWALRRGSIVCFHCVHVAARLLLVLGVVLLGSAAIAIRKNATIAAPGWVAGLLDGALEPHGLALRWERLEFDRRGNLRVEGASLVDVRLDAVLATARLVRVDPDLSGILAGKPGLDGMAWEGARVVAPALVTADGAGRVLVEDCAGRVTHRAGEWTLQGVRARFAGSTLRVDGAWKPPFAAPDPDRPRKEPRALLLGALRDGSRAADLLAEHGPISVAARLHRSAAGDLLVDATARLDRWAHASGWTVSGVVVETLSLDPERLRAPRGILASWEAVEGPGGFGVGAGAAEVFVDASLPHRVNRVRLACGGITTPWLGVDAVTADARLARWPELALDACAWSGGRRVEIEADADATAWTGTVGARSELDVRAILAGMDLPVDLDRYFRFGEPPRLAATARFGPGFKPMRADVEAELRGGVLLGWPIDRIEAVATWTPERLVARSLRIENPGYAAEGSYEEDFRSRAYRLRLKGGILPSDLDPLFGDWWDDLWPQFGFGEAPRVDLSIAGWWNGSEERFIWGSVAGERTSFRGVAFDRIAALLRVEENYVDIHGLRGEGPDGELAGELAFLLHGRRAGVLTTLLDLRSRATLRSLGLVAGPETAMVLEAFTPTARPEVAIRGWIHSGVGPLYRRLDVAASTPDPISYRGIGLDRLALRFEDDGTTMRLDPVDAGFGGGTGRGTATFTGVGGESPRLALDVALRGASYARTLDLIRGLDGDEEGEAEGTAMKAVVTPDGLDRARDPVPEAARIDLDFRGSGPADSTDGFTGSGRFEVRDADFAHVQVFGALSRLFEKTVMGFSTVKLTDASGTFVLGEEFVEMPDLLLVGPLSRASASGTYARRGGELDFKVRVALLSQSEGLFSGILQPVLNPLGRILELRLTGQMEDPGWSFVVIDPRNWFGGSKPAP